jgi:ATP-dependent Clp protease, protease subunit
MGRSTIINASATAGYGDEGSMLQLSERIVYLAGEVNEMSIAHVTATLIALANQDKTSPIKLIVSTYGGSVDEMFSLYDVMKYVPCPVHTIAIGKVMSAGVLLVAAGSKGNRLIGKSTRIMVHPISAGMEGTVFTMENEMAETRRMQQLMEELLLAETKMSKAQLQAIMKKGHDTYLTAKEAVKLGIVDAIFEPREKK